MEKTMGGDKYN